AFSSGSHGDVFHLSFCYKLPQMACSDRHRLGLDREGLDFFKDIRRKARWLTYSAVSFSTLFDAERVVPQLAAMLNERFDLQVLR
ncbi:Hypothetical predicted protein, partial [Paramuricea clavata]